MIEKKIVNVDNMPEDFRIVVISDIHGHKNLYKELVNHVGLRDTDYLVILGDFVEKGPDSLYMIHKMRDLMARENTFVLMGNCEAAMIGMLESEEYAEGLMHYLTDTPWQSLLKDTVKKLKINLKTTAPIDVQTKLRNALEKELAALKALPTAVVMDQFVFVHAGVEHRKDWQESSLSSMLEQQYFMRNGHCIEDKYVVVGHMPTSNYSDVDIDNSVIINHRERIISVDGGVGVKEVSQLNALIITKEDEGYIYKQKHVDEFEKCEILFKSHSKFENSVKVAWPNTEIEVLQIGTSFSWCRKLSTKELVFVKNEFIYEKDGNYFCKDDYVSSMISVHEGDRVSLVHTYGKYAYVMKHGKVGWIKTDRLKPVMHK